MLNLEIFVPSRRFIRRHGFISRVLVKVGRVRRPLDRRLDGRGEGARLQALPVESLQV